MQEEKTARAVTVSYEVTKEAVKRSEGGIIDYEDDRKSCDFGLEVGRYFDWSVVDSGTPEEPTETHTLQLVVMTRQEYDRLSEIEFASRQYEDEADDNAQPEAA